MFPKLETLHPGFKALEKAGMFHGMHPGGSLASPRSVNMQKMLAGFWMNPTAQPAIEKRTIVDLLLLKRIKT